MHLSNIAEVQGARYTRAMSAALGAYLKTLREGRKLRPSEVLRQLESRLGKSVDQTRLWRAEKGTAWPDGDFLTALLDILGANFSDIAWFQRTPDATEEDGRTRAEQVLKPTAHDWIARIADTDEKRIALLRRIYELSEDPELRARISGYLDGLTS